MNRAEAVGGYGKIECQADFFRTNAGEFSQSGLDRWFEGALEAMRAEGGRLPEGPTGFLLAPRGAAHVFLGAFAPSTDAAGRSFPLVIFGEIDASAASGALPTLLATAAPFLAAAGDLAVEGGRLSGSELVERLGALALPHLQSGIGPGDGRLDPAFASESSHDLAVAVDVVDPAQGVGAPRALAYALRTMGLACDQASKYGPDAAAGVITVDAPARNPTMRRLWLELVQRRLHWHDGLPSLLWTEPSADATGRLLLTLGPPSSAAFGYLANPRHRSPRFWPLRTDVSVALDQALQALSTEQRQLVEDPSGSLGDLIAAFSS